MIDKSKPEDIENNVLDLLAKIENTARKKFLPSIGPVKGKILQDITNEHKPMNVLEIGTLHGYSAILIAHCILIQKSQYSNDDGDNNSIEPIVISVEKDRKLAEIARRNIEFLKLSNKIHVIDGDALQVIPNIKSRFSMVFLDATKNEYLKYLRLIEKQNLLNKGAVVVADNVIIYENEMKDYLDYVRNSGNYISHTTETTLEFTKNVKDALEVSVNVVV